MSKVRVGFNPDLGVPDQVAEGSYWEHDKAHPGWLNVFDDEERLTGSFTGVQFIRLISSWPPGFRSVNDMREEEGLEPEVGLRLRAGAA